MDQYYVELPAHTKRKLEEEDMIGWYTIPVAEVAAACYSNVSELGDGMQMALEVDDFW